MHMSLDGYVAGPAGEMDWIALSDEMFDLVGKWTDRTGTALYGRVTYEMMQSYWPTAAEKPGATKHDIEHSTWYNKVHKVVLSKTLRGQDLANTEIISEGLADRIDTLKRQAGQDIIIFGSPGASQSLMQNDLIDEYWIFLNPVLLGRGIPLFGDSQNRSKLKLLESVPYSMGVVGLHYERVRK